MDERNRGARACAQIEQRRTARGGADGGDIRPNLLGAVNRFDLLLHGDDVLRRADGDDGFHGLLFAAVPVQNVHLILQGRIADGNAHEKAVHLRFRQGIGAHEIDRILRCQNHKRTRQRIGHAVNRHLTLLHDFEQRGLRFRRCAVDFVGEDNLAHDCAGTVLHFARQTGHREAGDIRRGDIRRKLNTLKRAGKRTRQRAGERRLAHARNILNEHMPFAQQRGEHQFHNVILTDDGAGYILLEGGNHHAEIGHNTLLWLAFILMCAAGTEDKHLSIIIKAGREFGKPRVTPCRKSPFLLE